MPDKTPAIAGHGPEAAGQAMTGHDANTNCRSTSARSALRCSCGSYEQSTPSGDYRPAPCPQHPVERTGWIPTPEEADVVCLSGSMRFYPRILKVAADETAKGHIVLAPFSVVPPKEQGSDFKAMLDNLHLRKIDKSDRVIVVTDETGYIGVSTAREMAYARRTGKPIEIRRVPVAPSVETAGQEL